MAGSFGNYVYHIQRKEYWLILFSQPQGKLSKLEGEDNIGRVESPTGERARRGSSACVRVAVARMAFLGCSLPSKSVQPVRHSAAALFFVGFGTRCSLPFSVASLPLTRIIVDAWSE